MICFNTVVIWVCDYRNFLLTSSHVGWQFKSITKKKEIHNHSLEELKNGGLSFYLNLSRQYSKYCRHLNTAVFVFYSVGENLQFHDYLTLQKITAQSRSTVIQKCPSQVWNYMILPTLLLVRHCHESPGSHIPSGERKLNQRLPLMSSEVVDFPSKVLNCQLKEKYSNEYSVCLVTIC